MQKITEGVGTTQDQINPCTQDLFESILLGIEWNDISLFTSICIIIYIWILTINISAYY